jgi:2,5-diamino-6-(ribosylamino)-4(3H)-pyrimidinone 5'-phosphate reductase
MAMTADGKISSRTREPVRLGGPHDRDLLDRLRAASDAVIHGAGTIRADDPPMRIRSPERIAARERAGRPRHPLQVVVSRNLELPVSGRFFREPDVERLVVAPRSAAGDREREVARVAEVERIGEDSVPIGALLERLAARGVAELLAEGGGAFNFDLFAAGVEDAFFVTLTPWILGGRTAPTPVDGDGFPWTDRVALDLASVERVGDDLYVEYRVRR